MMQKERKYFNEETILNVLMRLGKNLKRAIPVILIGGGAMSIKGDKTMTKDVDVVIIDPEDRTDFCSAIHKLGFRKKVELFGAYKNMDAGIYTDPVGFQIDVFSEIVCKRFIINNHVIRRARYYKDFHNLKVKLLSNEDIFLSKSVTERDHDLTDMYALFIQGLREETIIEEVQRQTVLSETTLWGAFLKVKLDEIEEKFKLNIPWKDRVEKIAIQEMESMLETSKGNK